MQVELGRGKSSAAITEDGSLYTWGQNSYGSLGNGNKSENSSVPIKIMDNVASVSLGYWHGAAITTDGSLYTWGYNYFDQLGNGTSDLYKATPVKIMDDVVLVSLGFYSSAAITTDGSLYTWGDNFHGGLGDGTTTYRSTPVKIMDNVASVSLGYEHSAAITTDGSLYTWGDNEIGQLGNGLSGGGYQLFDEGIDSNVPIKIASPKKDTATVSLNASVPVKATTGETPQTSLTDLEPDTVYNYYLLSTPTPTHF